MSTLFVRSARTPLRRTIGGYGKVQRYSESTTGKIGIAQDTEKKGDVLQKGARRDPELYVSFDIGNAIGNN
jgi:hypothetical protein